MSEPCVRAARLADWPSVWLTGRPVARFAVGSTTFLTWPQKLKQLLQGNFTVGHHRNINLYTFTNRGGVNIYVNNTGIRRKSRNSPSHAVVKAHAHGNQHITGTNGLVGGVKPVHTQHTQV